MDNNSTNSFAVLQRLDDEGATGLTINESMSVCFLSNCEKAIPKAMTYVRGAEVTINDSMDDETFEQRQAAIDVRLSKHVFDGPMNDLVQNHLNLLQDVQFIPSLSTPSEETFVQDTLGEEEEDCSGDGSKGSPRSVGLWLVLLSWTPVVTLIVGMMMTGARLGRHLVDQPIVTLRKSFLRT